MKLTVPLCPECGEPAWSIYESVQADYCIKQREDGEFEYAEDVHVYYETSEIMLTPAGLANVQCDNRHEWLTAILP